MNEDCNIEMGDYEIYCNKDKSQWRLWDNFNNNDTYFRSLSELLNYIDREVASVEIEG